MTSRIYTSVCTSILTICSCAAMSAFAADAQPAKILSLPVAGDGAVQEPAVTVKPAPAPAVVDQNTMPGQSVSYGKQQVNQVNANGNVNLYNTKVKNSTKVNGDFSATNADLQDVSVKGSADLFNTVVAGTINIYGSAQFGSVAMTGLSTSIYGGTILRDSAFTNPVNVYGNLSVNNCKIYSDLVTTSQSTQIIGSNVNNIRLTSTGNENGKPVLYLNGTTVKGNIKFDNEFGTVVLEGKSVIKGKVINGDLISK